MVVREFELVEEEDTVRALPFGDFEGAAGATANEALDAAAANLCSWAQEKLESGSELPWADVGHAAQHGGTIVVVAIEPQAPPPRTVSMAEAAQLLGVTTSCVSSLCKRGKLVSWKVGGARLVELESIQARLREKPGPGRPRTAGRSSGAAA